MFEDLRDTLCLSKGVGDTGGPYWVSPYNQNISIFQLIYTGVILFKTIIYLSSFSISDNIIHSNILIPASSLHPKIGIH
jgi:hypothetical protein